MININLKYSDIFKLNINETVSFDVAVDRAESFVFKSAEQRYKELVQMQPDIVNNIPLYHISSYLGFAGPSLSRIRKRISGR